MNVQDSRKQRRMRRAKASKKYGIKGDDALLMERAYQAHQARNMAEAARLAQEIGLRYPRNLHPWLLLGAIAVEHMDGDVALVFFENAEKIAPGDTRVLAGKGKAHFLKADAFGAVEYLGKAIQAGSKDLGAAGIYADLVARMKRFTEGAKKLSLIAKRLGNVQLWLRVGDLYLADEKFLEAAAAFMKAYEIDPESADTRIAYIKALMFRHEFFAAERHLSTLKDLVSDNDEILTLEMMILRNLGRWDEAIALLDRPFHTPLQYQQALAQAAYVHMDKQNHIMAERYLSHAVYIDNAGEHVARKSLATYLFRMRRYEEGAHLFRARAAANIVKQTGAGPTISEILSANPDFFLLAEQGVGDQFAMLPLINVVGIRSTQTYPTFIGEDRMAPVLEASNLPLRFMSADEFSDISDNVGADRTILLGDLVGIGGPRAGNLGGYICPDAAAVARLRERYASVAKGRPIFGIAWKSKESLTGYHRSIPLASIVSILPPQAFVVSLQYGDCQRDIEAAKNARPDVTIFEDESVDQMADLMSFLVQIQALDRIITIDNTTAHACGALGHEETYLLIPAGAECMWYWGVQGATDPWYGTLKLVRQQQVQDWTAPLEALRNALNRSPFRPDI